MKQRRMQSLFCIAVVLLGTFSVFASGAPESSLHGTQAIDALGRTVELPDKPSVIAVVGKAALIPSDALFMFPIAQEAEVYLSTTDQGLGDFFPLLKPSITGDKRLAQQASAEEILALKPDLILMKSSNYQQLGKQLEQFNLPLFVMDLESSEAWKEEILQLGKLLDDTATAQNVVAELQRREDAIATQIATIDPNQKPTVVYAQATSQEGTLSLSVSPNVWIQQSLVEKAGAIPIWVDQSITAPSWRTISFEQLAAWKPDVLVLISYRQDAKQLVERFHASLQWQFLGTKVFASAADVVNYAQADSRWILALQHLAKTLYPDLFATVSMAEEVRSFYRTIYNVEDTDVLNLLVDSYIQSVN